jgi:hypothetical protein
MNKAFLWLITCISYQTLVRQTKTEIMKTSTRPIKVLSLVVLGLLVFSSTDAQVPARINFSLTEPTIDLRKYIRTYSELEPQKKEFKNSFKIAPGNKNVKKQGDTVLAHLLVSEMYQKALAALSNDTLCKAKNCITALRITYGLKGRDLKFLYQPLYLIQKHAGVDSVFAISELSPPVFYTYEASSSTPSFVVEQNATRYIIQYQRNIKIKRQPADNVHDNHTSADPVSIIFSFQEILRFYHQIYPSESGPFYISPLAIHSSSAEYPRGSAKSATHTLFMTNYDWSKLSMKALETMKVLSPADGGDGANLAHLCPPSCTEITYSMQ